MMALRAGLLGIGMMGRHHARVLREVEGLELVAIADPGGDPHGVAAGLDVLPDVEALIASGIDIAVVAVPTRHHFAAAMALAEAGIHTLVEKPIAHSTEAGRLMAHAFSSRGLVGAVGHVERFNPALQELRRRLANGDVGEVYQIATRRQSTFPARIADVGVGMDLASHDIDLTAWVAQSEYKTVYAQTTFKSGREYEDMIALTGRLSNGVIVNHLINWLSPMKERVTVVTGDRGTYIADTATGDLTFHANGTIALEWDSVSSFRGVSEGDVTRFSFAKREPLRVEHEAFRDAVLGLPSNVVTMEQGLHTLEVVEGALTSAADGASVTF
ncbi:MULTISPECIES: Gfo/Idh/MocA family oxidoreductase [unclassified Microbacterium]|uniref:Gfo/Idh/MocA family protein n=1 Tax=unclassified Microbacterium TaxID=2609290 RepID=UPI00214BC67C|nr:MULTISPECIES: Gfo/Idh/MocA family oxidoreductase [unclassified Microbacterium]MCR2810273.1 Gfo/Idh/MocA family oxidoreductase [Microbacterium sp. zg.B185]WIM20967.1 Gfo/Idh/MocA family oxidoreductase [Microbacterium sp. zg-B185]